MSHPNNLTKVFVYGTLLRGQPNHHLLDDRDLISEAATNPNFTLITLGAFPAMIQGGSTSVQGELYQVDPATLVALDRLEGHPSFYRRQSIKLKGGAQALTYLLSKEQGRGYPIIFNGDWRSVSEESWS